MLVSQNDHIGLVGAWQYPLYSLLCLLLLRSRGSHNCISQCEFEFRGLPATPHAAACRPKPIMIRLGRQARELANGLASVRRQACPSPSLVSEKPIYSFGHSLFCIQVHNVVLLSLLTQSEAPLSLLCSLHNVMKDVYHPLSHTVAFLCPVTYPVAPQEYRGLPVAHHALSPPSHLQCWRHQYDKYLLECSGNA